MSSRLLLKGCGVCRQHVSFTQGPTAYNGTSGRVTEGLTIEHKGPVGHCAVPTLVGVVAGCATTLGRLTTTRGLTTAAATPGWWWW